MLEKNINEISKKLKGNSDISQSEDKDALLKDSLVENVQEKKPLMNSLNDLNFKKKLKNDHLNSSLGDSCNSN